MSARLQAITRSLAMRLGVNERRNALSTSFATSLAPARARWQAFDPRVQRIIKFSLALLALAIIWAYLWLPAARGRAQLAERIPQMAAQLATMRSQAEEVRSLNAMPPVIGTRSQLPLADVAALQALFGANAKVSLDESRAFRISIPAIAYTAWLDQLDGVLSRYRVRVASVSLKPLPAAEGKAAATKTSAEVAVALTLIDDNDRRP